MILIRATLWAIVMLEATITAMTPAVNVGITTMTLITPRLRKAKVTTTATSQQ